ncbi:MAG TPA: hypothetical protein PK090_09630, partial [Smithellaceae bacterium]|nr:hypothetical protein [Smithellaceae bacterium]
SVPGCRRPDRPPGHRHRRGHHDAINSPALPPDGFYARADMTGGYLWDAGHGVSVIIFRGFACVLQGIICCRFFQQHSAVDLFLFFIHKAVSF